MGEGKDNWICPLLQKHFEKYGEVTDTWMPWETTDRQGFARVWFKDYEAAEKAVKASSHLIGKSSFVVAFQRPSVNGENGVTAQKEEKPSVDEFLVRTLDGECKQLS